MEAMEAEQARVAEPGQALVAEPERARVAEPGQELALGPEQRPWELERVQEQQRPWERAVVVVVVEAPCRAP